MCNTVKHLIAALRVNSLNPHYRIIPSAYTALSIHTNLGVSDAPHTHDVDQHVEPVHEYSAEEGSLGHGVIDQVST